MPRTRLSRVAAYCGDKKPDHRGLLQVIFSVKWAPVSRRVKVGDINGALHFLTHTFLICSTVSSLSRFLVITLLCFWNNRANQAWRMTSPTRTLKAVIFLLSLLFFFFFLSQIFFRQLPGLCSKILIAA